MKEIYLDNAAATPLSAQAVRAITRAQAIYANPSSFSDAGRKAAATLADARARIARFLNARPDEIILCSSGSEANNLALTGTLTARRGTVLVADTEHLSVLQPLRKQAGKGVKILTLPVDPDGIVSVADILSRLSASTVLVSVMYANNEIGTIQPVARIGQAIARWRREHRVDFPLFHVDACQATTTLDMNVQRLCADLLTLNGSKAYGPHGVAVLYARRGVQLVPLVLGGGQEGGRRAGTEDVAGAAGLAAALETVRPRDASRWRQLRDRLIRGILKEVPGSRLNGPTGDRRLAGNVNVSIPGCDSENLLLELDRTGIRAGSGSACTAHSVEPSHVLTAIGTQRQYLSGALRFSLGRTTTRADIDAVIRTLPQVASRLRERRAKR